MIQIKYIFVNNLAYAHKNLITLLQAFKSILDKTNHNLVISGPIYKNDREANILLQKLIDSKRLLLTGYLHKEDFDNVLYNADLFVNTSSFEGFGMSAVEAMYAEVPCLLADNSAVREVTKNLAYYYSPAKDYLELSNKLSEVLSIKKDKIKLKENSEIMQESYNYLTVAQKYFEHFYELKQNRKIFDSINYFFTFFIISL